MRYCPHCHRLNPGHPVICHYCGRTWYVRLCPRGHENPPYSLHCGTCGAVDLSETAGHRSWRLYCLKILIAAFFCVILFFLGNLLLQSFTDNITPLILAIISFMILLIGYLFSLSLLPQTIKTLFTKLHRYVLKGCVGLVLFLWEKVKELMKLLINW